MIRPARSDECGAVEAIVQAAYSIYIASALASRQARCWTITRGGSPKARSACLRKPMETVSPPNFHKAEPAVERDVLHHLFVRIERRNSAKPILRASASANAMSCRPRPRP
jgi:hypothetical protein